MDRKANLPAPPAPTSTSSNHARPIPAGGEANLTSSSSSSSSSFSSSPNLLRHLHAAVKRQRPLGLMQSNFSRASRVVVGQTEASKNSTSNPFIATTNKVSKLSLSQGEAPGGSARSLNAAFDIRKDSAAEIRMNPVEDSSLTPPSITGTVTTALDENMSSFGLQKGERASLASSSSHLASKVASSDGDLKKDHFPCAGNAGSTIQKGRDHLGNQAAISDQNPEHQDLQNIDISGCDLNFGGANILDKRDEPRYRQHFVDPMTRSTVLGSSCATTMSVHLGPTFQSTHAPLGGQTGVSSHMLSPEDASLGNVDNALPERRDNVVKEAAQLQGHQEHLHSVGDSKERGISGHMQSLVSSKINPPSNVDMEPSQTGKVEKAPRKMKYDPDVFVKVNGKRYQKLGKIGSGGSSEVHKVISSDCSIYALKKIKLKGRDTATACGFCQEIEYLNKLKGKSNIIQLIDYEVTDKTLLQEVMKGSMTVKDARIKDDQYIYMVLEYGEIDLAHMLSHKWREMDGMSTKIDENWLRFYWQQMLEAVNTIHEERIVHSDLKPANFLLVRGSLKLIDFGIAKAIMSDTTNIQRDAQVGTLNYMSPEAFMWNEQDASGNTIKCGRPSDIWSLGCILYQMVYGKTPFAEYKTFWAKFKVITDKNHEITYEPVSNPWLIDLMRRCLAWDRSERWRIPQLLQHPFLVPPMPTGPSSQDHPSKFLIERIAAHWKDPEVSRLCTELHEVITNLERAQKDLGMHA